MTSVKIARFGNTIQCSGTFPSHGTPESLYSILKFFQVDLTGMFRMPSSARSFKAGVGSSPPHGRGIIGVLA
jgi:hypothetical protein